MTSQLLDMDQRKFHDWSTSARPPLSYLHPSKKIMPRSGHITFVAVNIHTHTCLYFYDWIKKISPYFSTGETDYFWNHKGTYYDNMPSVWKNMTLIKQIEVMYITDLFVTKNPDGKSSRTREIIFLSFIFCP